MKVTALIPDALIEDVRALAARGTLTDSLIQALEAWVASEKIKKLNQLVNKHPLEFSEKFSGVAVRHLNRRS